MKKVILVPWQCLGLYMGQLVFQVFRLGTRIFRNHWRRCTNGSRVGSEVTLSVRTLSSHVVGSPAVEALAASHAIFTLRLWYAASSSRKVHGAHLSTCSGDGSRRRSSLFWCRGCGCGRWSPRRRWPLSFRCVGTDLLSTWFSNMIYWSCSSGVSRVTRVSLSSAHNHSYNEVRLAASFQDTSVAYRWKSAK